MAIESISNFLKKGDLIVIESTCPVGTTEKICKWLKTLRKDLSFPSSEKKISDINIAHSPERILPGNILIELVNNDRIIGGITEICGERTLELYKIAIEGKCILTNARTAELVKLTENAYRDVNIAFANEVSIICDKLNIDPWETIKLANHHPRVNILKPGPGVGGHCIAVDPWFIVDSAPHITPLIQAARKVNDSKPTIIVQKVQRILKKTNETVIACFGLSYKGDIDDLRESPAMEITITLAKKNNLKILIVEPHIGRLPSYFNKYPNVCLTNIGDALSQSNIILLLTDHKAFKKIDPKSINGKFLIDTRGIWNFRLPQPPEPEF